MLELTCEKRTAVVAECPVVVDKRRANALVQMQARASLSVDGPRHEGRAQSVRDGGLADDMLGQDQRVRRLECGQRRDVYLVLAWTRLVMSRVDHDSERSK